MFLKKFFSNIWLWISTAFIVLFGLLKWEKLESKKLKKELESKEVDLKIKDFEATQAKIKNEVQNEDINIKPNSDITI